MRPHSWIVIANGTKVRFFHAENLQKTSEGEPLQLRDYISEDDMPSDQPGKTTERVGIGSPRAMEPKTLPKEKFATLFARKIAERLEQGLSAGDYDWIYLFAPPHFLGILRKELHPNVAKVVVAEFDKDLIHADFKEIKSHFAI